MTRLLASSLRLALILIQFLAPWVHAHVERETGGLLHIPGLERWGDKDGFTAAESDHAAAADRILGMQTGLSQEESSLLAPGDCPATGLSPASRLQPGRLQSTRPDPLGSSSPVPDLYFRSGSPPRASPAVGSSWA